jgi:hypothetical protein
MGDKIDILDDSRMRQLPYRVPQGYFEGLQARLSEIPSAQAEKRSAFRSFIPKLAPYFAMAACFTLALLVGKYLAGRTGVEAEPAAAEYSRYYEADLFPVTRAYISPEDEDEMDGLEADDEDIREYLISSRTSTGLIAYVLDE